MNNGRVQVDAFKRLAKVLKKRIEGCTHMRALERLARACGMQDYRQVLAASTQWRSATSLEEASRMEMLSLWKRRLSKAFSIDIDSVLTSEELEKWFSRVVK